MNFCMVNNLTILNTFLHIFHPSITHLAIITYKTIEKMTTLKHMGGVREKPFCLFIKLKLLTFFQ